MPRRRDGRSDDPVADRLKGIDFARGTLVVAADDPRILANAAHALAYFGEDIGAMIALVDRSLVLNPSYARGWLISSVLRSWAGQADTAIEHAEASLRLSPRARISALMSRIGSAHFFGQRFDQAVPKLLPLSRTIQAMRIRIGFSPLATRIWAGVTMPETSLCDYAPSPRS
jgi:hypothetical protein